MKKNFRFCILFALIFLFNTLIAKAEREVKKEDIELKNGIIYFKGEENSYNGIVKENYPNGKLKENLIVVNGKVNGNVKVYYENGNLNIIGKFKVMVINVKFLHYLKLIHVISKLFIFSLYCLSGEFSQCARKSVF